VRLNTNESPYPPPSSFLESLFTRIGEAELNRYPDRDANEVRERLAAHLGTITERVWAASGSNEILLQVLLAFGGFERKVMTFEPTYGMHSHIARIAGTRLLRGRRDSDFSIQPDLTVEAIRAELPDIVFLCSPNNPTGNSDPLETVAQICSAAPGIVVMDQAYAEFSDTTFHHLVEEFEHLIVVRSFSKAWRLAGVRIGYLIAQRGILEEIGRVRLPYHFSTLAQAAALAALDHSDELLGTAETIKHERDRVWRELSTTKDIVAFPSDANFIMFRPQKPAGEVWQSLLDREVLIRDFSDRRGSEGCLRVTIGSPEENEAFLEALAESL
jgi:histidinol-phosphate aminotransferase